MGEQHKARIPSVMLLTQAQCIKDYLVDELHVPEETLPAVDKLFCTGSVGNGVSLGEQ